MSVVHAGYLTTFVVSMGEEEAMRGEMLRSFYLALGQAYFLIFLELCVVAALGVFFSAISSPVFSAIATFCSFFIGHGLRNIKDLTEVVESRVGDLVLHLMYWILPSLFVFDIKHYAAYAQPRGAGAILGCIVYAVFYCTVILTLTCVIFRRRQL
jgi:hypothetical protein